MKKQLKNVKILMDIFFVLLLIFISSLLFYPKILEKITPVNIGNEIVFGKGKQDYTLTPMIKSINLPIDQNITQIQWERQLNEITTVSTTIDTRTQAIELLLVQFNSPLLPYANLFVTEADKNGSDWRLAVSIAGVESGFGKVIPQNSYNAWGWKGGPNGDWSRFSSWEEAIKYIVKRLAEGYGKKIKPIDMESVYCPPCGATGTHSWANGVQGYMNKLTSYDKSLSN